MTRAGHPPASRSLPPASQPDVDAGADATLARILNAIEEYVYTGEFRADGYQIVFAGPCREQFLGMTAEEARTAIWAYYVHPDDVELFNGAHAEAHRTGRLDVEYRLVGADGVLRWVRDRGRIRQAGRRRFLDGSILDVTAIHRVHEELEAARARADRLARTDALTGVANRRWLPELLTELEGVPLGVLDLDVDHFKQLNDVHGHAGGDAVLVELVHRLRRTLRSDDRIVRMGGEEFLVLLPGLADETALLDVAEKVRHCVSGAPFALGAHAVTVTASIGATIAFAEHDFDARLAIADRLMYAAKRAGRDRVRLTLADCVEDDGREELTEGMRVAHAMAAVAAAAEGMADDHLSEVSVLAARLARRLNAQPFEVLRCRLAGLLHDIGKVRLATGLLTKPGALTADEWALMRRHPEYGEAMIAGLPQLSPVATIVRHHHERYDGTGYPDGLAGDAIPFEARVIAVADTWHAMTSDRPYRDALPTAHALAELHAAAGGQLDPAVVAALDSILAEPRGPAGAV